MIRNMLRFAAILVGIGVVWGALSFTPSEAQAPAAGVVAFTGARVIDGTGAAPMEGATIVVSDGRIQAVGRNVAIPAGATRVDMAGNTNRPRPIHPPRPLRAAASTRRARHSPTPHPRPHRH